MAQFIQRHPTYRTCEVVVPVPLSNPNKEYDLPSFLAEEVGKRVGIPVPAGALEKRRATRPMKDCKTVQEKIDNVKDAYAARSAAVGGKKVLLVDDIYQTGFSINEVGRALKSAGAALVVALVATKTVQDLA
jgi:ATP-dependent DNA helicase RecQ